MGDNKKMYNKNWKNACADLKLYRKEVEIKYNKPNP
jgi:hypothetical protein